MLPDWIKFSLKFWSFSPNWMLLRNISEIAFFLFLQFLIDLFGPSCSLCSVN